MLIFYFTKHITKCFVDFERYRGLKPINSEFQACTIKFWTLTCTFTISINKNTMSPFEHFWPIYLTFELEGWPWPFTTQNGQLHEIHMHAKYQVAIFNIAKVMANVKVCANQQTNKQTNKRTGLKQYVPQYRLGDIKRIWLSCTSLLYDLDLKAKAMVLHATHCNLIWLSFLPIFVFPRWTIK